MEVVKIPVQKEQLKNSRKTGVIRNPEIKQCKICGKDFLKTSSMKLTCSPECSRLNMKLNQQKRQQEIYGELKEALRAKDRRYRHMHSTSKCRICGEIMQRDTSGDILLSRPQMHEECILHDCAITLSKGEKLSKKQFLRLQSRGWTLTEFREEYTEYV